MTRPMRSTIQCLFALVVLAVTSAGTSLAAEDWPQFRGPNLDGISTASGLLASWPAEGPKKVFEVPLGKGFSGLSIVDGKIYTQLGRDGDELVVALDAATGKEIWRFRTDKERPDGFGDGPRSTPLIEGDRLFTASAFGKLYALDRKSGQQLWSHDLVATFGARVPTWGVSTSPIIEGDRLVFNVGGKADYAVMAFDKSDGKVIWHSGDDQPGYSNPLPITVGGQRLVVIFSGTQVFIQRLDNGEIVWQKPWKTSYDINAASPLFIAPDRLFISSGYDTGSALFALRAADGKIAVDEIWKTRGMKNQFSSSVYRDGYIYGFDNKTFKCIDAKTGEDRWRQGGFGHGSLFFADGHFIVLGDNGKLALIEANPAKYVEKALTEPMKGKHWTVPTLYDGRLYIRNEKSLIALEVGT